MAKQKKPASKAADTAGLSKANGAGGKADSVAKAISDTTKSADSAAKPMPPVTPAKPASTPAKADVKAADAKAPQATATKAADVAKSNVAAKTAPAKAETPASTPASKPAEVAKATAAADKQAAATSKPTTATTKPSTTPPSKGETPFKSSADKAPAKAEGSKPAEVSKPTPKPTPPPPAPQESRGGFLPLALGGVVAGVIGFGAAEMNVLGMRDADTSLNTVVEAQADKIAELETAIANLPAPEMPDMPDMAPLQAEIGTLTGSVETLDARLTEFVNRPIVTTTGEVDVSAYEDQLADLQASVAAQKEEVERLLADARTVEEATAAAAAASAEAARVAVVQGAMTDVTAAITEGAPFADALGVMQDNGVADIPAALSDVAENGVTALTSLQSGFTASARDALGAARSSGEQEGEAGFGGFLKRSLGARSVAPREGSDPDAVLSRAEAAMRDGALDAALSELDTLPASAQDAMGAWLADARARMAARTAAQDLSERLTAN